MSPIQQNKFHYDKISHKEIHNEKQLQDYVDMTRLLSTGKNQGLVSEITEPDKVYLKGRIEPPNLVGKLIQQNTELIDELEKRKKEIFLNIKTLRKFIDSQGTGMAGIVDGLYELKKIKESKDAEPEKKLEATKIFFRYLEDVKTKESFEAYKLIQETKSALEKAQEIAADGATLKDGHFKKSSENKLEISDLHQSEQSHQIAPDKNPLELYLHEGLPQEENLDLDSLTSSDPLISVNEAVLHKTNQTDQTHNQPLLDDSSQSSRYQEALRASIIEHRVILSQLKETIQILSSLAKSLHTDQLQESQPSSGTLSKRKLHDTTSPSEEQPDAWTQKFSSILSQLKEPIQILSSLAKSLQSTDQLLESQSSSEGLPKGEQHGATSSSKEQQDLLQQKILEQVRKSAHESTDRSRNRLASEIQRWRKNQEEIHQRITMLQEYRDQGHMNEETVGTLNHIEQAFQQATQDFDKKWKSIDSTYQKSLHEARSKLENTTPDTAGSDAYRRLLNDNSSLEESRWKDRIYEYRNRIKGQEAIIETLTKTEEDLLAKTPDEQKNNVYQEVRQKLQKRADERIADAINKHLKVPVERKAQIWVRNQDKIKKIIEEFERYTNTRKEAIQILNYIKNSFEQDQQEFFDQWKSIDNDYKKYLHEVDSKLKQIPLNTADGFKKFIDRLAMKSHLHENWWKERSAEYDTRIKAQEDFLKTLTGSGDEEATASYFSSSQPSLANSNRKALFKSLQGSYEI